MIENLKMMLDINDTSLDTKLAFLLENAKARLKVRLGGIEPPETLNYIIVEVANKRFNRIGSEGLQIHTLEGESLHFTDDDFEEFAEDIQAYLDTQKTSDRGKVRFL